MQRELEQTAAQQGPRLPQAVATQVGTVARLAAGNGVSAPWGPTCASNPRGFEKDRNN